MYKLNLTPQQLSIINSALQGLPFKVAAPLFDELNRQIKAIEDAAAKKQMKSDKTP